MQINPIKMAAGSHAAEASRRLACSSDRGSQGSPPAVAALSSESNKVSIIEAKQTPDTCFQPAVATELEPALSSSDSNKVSIIEGITGFSKIFCETSQKLVSVEAFALAAKYYSIQNLGICTPFEQLLVALRGNKEEKTGDNVKPDEFMNLKKSHEVQAMSELISSIADYCGIKQALERVAVGQGLPEKMIMDYYEKYKPRMNELEAFNMLKVVLAPCIETLILLDRLCYLKEQEDIAWSALVKLFDPVKSPRCYAVIALKQQQ
ncbi:hypothetical protein D623_10034141 [Myotis brandtii]|uniref:Uncharacterized protein n=1 Tax=Myotis brandtii TaxID=109478 RepID=S7Q6B5_MYOBR|nr:hypothetical protein D623_10034141 [Myotis brandtii]